MSLSEKIGCFIFDLDGTLVMTYSEYYNEQFGKAFDHFGLKKDKELFRRLWFDDNRSRIIRDLGVDAEKFWKYYNGIEDLEFRKKCISFYSNKDRHVMSKLMEKSIKTAVITGTAEKIMDLEVDFFGKGFFDACYSTYETKARKSTLITICINNFNAERNRCVYVGNSDKDIIESKIAGVKSVLVEREEYPVREMPDYRVKSLDEILKFT
jgi:phosphoglycolate phosphatase-like HAD superfamily hydrolase